MSDDNVIPLRAPKGLLEQAREFDDASSYCVDDWNAIVAQELVDLRNEVLMTNSLIRRLLKTLRENL